MLSFALPRFSQPVTPGGPSVAAEESDDEGGMAGFDEAPEEHDEPEQEVR